MPTLEEMQESMEQTGASQAERNQQVAQAVQTGALVRGLGATLPEQGPELTREESEAKWTGHQQELTDEEVAARMTPEPEDVVMGTIRSMAQNYQTSQQYRELLDQELDQISAQIAALTQRRNMIEMAKGQG